MGPFFSRFRRKQTTVELLEQIDKEISRLQKNRKVNQHRQKQFVTSLLIYSIAAYVIGAVIFFCICFPETWQLRLLYSIPLLIFPVLVWVVKRSLHWYFVQRISSNDAALEELRDTRNQILEDVMETETYKRAREILEKFDPARLHQLEGIPEAAAYSILSPTKSAPLGTENTMIHQRTFQAARPFPVRTQASSAGLQEQNGAPHLSSQLVEEHLRDSESPPVYPVQAEAGPHVAQPPRPPMPRSVLPRERGVMDKLMDYLVGDGPENRYALICQQCFSHNGMALKEEFEYFSFRCCYCYCINPARKQRPMAPRLQFFAPPGLRPADDAGGTDTSASDPDSEDDQQTEDQNASHQIPSQTGISECIAAVKSVGPVDSLASGNAGESLYPQASGNTGESLNLLASGNTGESLDALASGNTGKSLYPQASGNTGESLDALASGNTGENLDALASGNTGEILNAEIIDIGLKRPVPDCEATDLTDGESRNAIKETHEAHSVGMVSQENLARALETQFYDEEKQPGDELHQSTREKLQHMTTHVDQHSHTQEPETPGIQHSDKQEPETPDPEIQYSDKQEPETPEIQHSDKQEHVTPEIQHSDKQEHVTPEIQHSDKQEPETPEIQHLDKQEPETLEIQHSDKQESETSDPDIQHSDEHEPETSEIQHSDRQEPETSDPDIQHSDNQKPETSDPDIQDSDKQEPETLDPEIQHLDKQEPETLDPEIQHSDKQNLKL